MYLSEFNGGRLRGLGALGVSQAQHDACQAQLLNLMAALSTENYQWSLAASYGESPPSPDQHNATVASLQAQIAQAQACAALPVDAPAPAPAPAPPPAAAPAAAPAPPPAAGAPAPATAPIVPTPGATQVDTSLIPYDVEVASVSGPGGTLYGPGAAGDDKGGAGWLWLLIGGAALVVGGG